MRLKTDGTPYVVYATGEFGGRYGLELDAATGTIHNCLGSDRVYLHPLRQRTAQRPEAEAPRGEYSPAVLTEFVRELRAMGHVGPLSVAWVPTPEEVAAMATPEPAPL